MCASGPDGERERGNFVAEAEADRVIYSKIIQEAGIKNVLQGEGEEEA